MAFSAVYLQTNSKFYLYTTSFTTSKTFGDMRKLSVSTTTGITAINCTKMLIINLKSWLSKIGSPSSRIDRTNFSNEKTISKLEYSNFSIRY
ncbi:hypothetical protein FD755_024756 [Muntiacus reevesi]|uniref:acylphosphatase n=1 Tax=Muntiacus reevesi TaxID=9886 RepID=A0A5N3UU84_MUNRE|nr:hypothetical protein FD755_024756 [Muntiacus reevesi]